jgi:uncharacterized protein DUF87
MKKLKLSSTLSLPAEDALESAIAIIGKRGRGKSGLVKVLLEELCRVGLPFVAFDPVGIMWGLRSSLDGKSSSGLQVLIVGGQHGDLKLERRGGAEVARAVVQANVSCIIDFSEESKAVYREFVTDFSHALFAANDAPRMVVIEEAPELVPQRLRPDLTATFEAVERLVSRGRNKGLGCILVSQRAATIHKDVLTQIDAMFIFGLTSPQDRKAIGEWVESKDDAKRMAEFSEGIAGLERQEAWFWSPEVFGDAFQKIKVRPFHTFHPDKTHLRRQGLLHSKPVTADVSGLIVRLGEQMERLAKTKNEVSEVPKLRSQIRALEAQIVNAKAAYLALANTIKPSVSEKQIVRLEKTMEHFEKRQREVLSQITGLHFVIDQKGKVSGPTSNLSLLAPRNGKSESTKTALYDLRSTGTDSLTNPEQRILDAIGWMESIGIQTPRQTAVAFLAGYRYGGGAFMNPRGRLRSRNLVEYVGGDCIALTGIGRNHAHAPSAPPTTEELHARVFARLNGPEKRILDPLLKAFPNPMTKAELGEHSRYDYQGGAFANALGRLRSIGLVDYPSPGHVVAQQLLFPENH